MTRSTVAQVQQIGKETVAGTAVPATRRLGSLEINASVTSEAELFRARGMKFPTVQAQNREWAEVDLSGQATYEEIIYPLSGALDVATVAQVMDGGTPTGAWEWTFQPDSNAADAPVTFTLESGEDVSGQAERFAHVLFTQFGLDISRGGIGLSGSGFARKAEIAFDMTNGLSTQTGLTPILPGQVSVFADATYAGLGTTRLGRVVSAAPSIADRYNPAWFLDASQPSFTTFVENAAGAGGEFGLTVEADTAGMAWLTRLRTGVTYFVRVEAAGANIYNAGTKPNLTHLFRWDMAVKVSDVDAWSDEDGIYALPFTLAPVHDSTAGFAHRVMVRNTVQTL